MDGVDETLILAFTEHMGHSPSIDKNVYAVPLAVREVLHVGSLMSIFDQIYTR